MIDNFIKEKLKLISDNIYLLYAKLKEQIGNTKTLCFLQEKFQNQREFLRITLMEIEQAMKVTEYKSETITLNQLKIAQEIFKENIGVKGTIEQDGLVKEYIPYFYKQQEWADQLDSLLVKDELESQHAHKQAMNQANMQLMDANRALTRSNAEIEQNQKNEIINLKKELSERDATIRLLEKSAEGAVISPEVRKENTTGKKQVPSNLKNSMNFKDAEDKPNNTFKAREMKNKSRKNDDEVVVDKSQESEGKSEMIINTQPDEGSQRE